MKTKLSKNNEQAWKEKKKERKTTMISAGMTQAKLERWMINVERNTQIFPG